MPFQKGSHVYAYTPMSICTFFPNFHTKDAWLHTYLAGTYLFHFASDLLFLLDLPEQSLQDSKVFLG